MQTSVYKIMFVTPDSKIYSVFLSEKTKLPERLVFDGSSIEGFQTIEESDLVLRKTRNFPIVSEDNLERRVMYSVFDKDGNPYSKCSRGLLEKVLSDLERKNIFPFVAPEIEFFILSKDKKKPVDNNKYLSPILSHEFLEVLKLLKKSGIRIRKFHHEVVPGQYEIGIDHNSPLIVADEIIYMRDIFEEISFNHDMYYVELGPKPFLKENGSGMHIHFSLWRNGFDNREPLFYNDDIMRYAIGGILYHAKALTTILNPTEESYKRLVPDSEAPTKIAWGHRNRSCLIRIPHFNNVEHKRIEIRSPDNLCNPYLSFAAIILAAMDGIERKINPGKPMEENVYNKEEVRDLPSSLNEALEELEDDSLLNEYFNSFF